MITLATPVTQANIRKWSAKRFDVEVGTVRLAFESNDDQVIVVECLLSNDANGSIGAKINPTPEHWRDRIVPSNHGVMPLGAGGVGAANSFDSARTAYVNAYTAHVGSENQKHKAGLKAVELRALTDGWVEASLTGA